MKIVKRYVISEILKVFVVTIVITMMLFTLGGGLREGLRRGLPPHLLARTMIYVVPEMLRFTIPGCLLFAVCTVFGRMTASNEIVAIKSLGINPLRIIRPVLVTAYVLSLVTYAMYDACAVWGRPGLQRLVAESVDQIAYGYLRANGSFSSHGMSIVVKGIRGDRLLNPVIRIEPRGDKPALTLTAKTARLRMDRAAGTLRLECEDGQVEAEGRGSVRFPDRLVHDVVLTEPDPHPENHASPASLGTRAIPGQIAREKGILAEIERKLALANRSGAVDARRLRDELSVHRTRLHRLRAEIPRRFSNGLGCLCFALIGVPVAMGRRSSDTMSVFFLCFLPILLVYYPLLVIGENLAREGVFPELSVWLADAVLLAIGSALLVRQMRH